MGRSRTRVASLLPLWWTRDFPGEPGLIGQARSWIAELLPACDPLEDLLMFASELGTNAITHTRSGRPGGRFTVEVTWSPRAARVVVGDQGADAVPACPANAADPEAFLESGRGLLMIDMMSAAWGIAGDAAARWLWADVHWRSHGGPLPTAPEGDGDAARQLAALHHAYPGTSAWYSQQSGDWRAAPPQAQGAGGILTAPSPAALAHMLAARYPPAPTSDPAQPGHLLAHPARRPTRPRVT